jgi:hypothetical protein
MINNGRGIDGNVVVVTKGLITQATVAEGMKLCSVRAVYVCVGVGLC